MHFARMKGNEVFRLVAEGNVHVVSPSQEVFGDRGVYDADQKISVMTGQNLRLLTKTDVVTARDALEYYENDKLAVARARKIQRFLSQPFTVAQNFTGTPGKYVSLKDTIKGFKMIVNGECDALPEQAFYMVGGIEEAFEKAKTMN